jgi:glycosyltransferase involved in cell wall biosynthesis
VGGRCCALPHRQVLAQASGELILIQDADLEYSPAEYPRLLAPILAGQADVVYGSRFIGGESKRVLFFWHSLGNKVLTNLSNMFTNLNLTDMETCYKVMTKEVLNGILPKLSAQRFGIEPELTALFARGPWRIYEVGITYNGRTYAEGKKINWRDGLAAFWHIIKFNLFR